MDQKKGLQRTKIVREQSSPYCKLKFVRQNWRTSDFVACLFAYFLAMFVRQKHFLLVILLSYMSWALMRLLPRQKDKYNIQA